MQKNIWNWWIRYIDNAKFKWKLLIHYVWENCDTTFFDKIANQQKNDNACVVVESSELNKYE